MAKYVVAGSAIFVGDPENPSRARKCMPGEVVELSAAEAKHFVAIKRLEPYIPDEDEAPAEERPVARRRKVKGDDD